MIEVQVHETTDSELLAEIREYEQRFGCSSKAFYKLWLVHEWPDTDEANCWAVLYRQAQELGLLPAQKGA